MEGTTISACTGASFVGRGSTISTGRLSLRMATLSDSWSTSNVSTEGVLSVTTITALGPAHPSRPEGVDAAEAVTTARRIRAIVRLSSPSSSPATTPSPSRGMSRAGSRTPVSPSTPRRNSRPLADASSEGNRNESSRLMNFSSRSSHRDRNYNFCSWHSGPKS